MARPPRRAAIALGSNLGDRHAHIQAAIETIARLPQTVLVGVSTVHQTEPVPSPGSDVETIGGPFLNAVAVVETSLSPQELLEALFEIERAHGRRRDPLGVWTARSLDLDLILVDNKVVNTPSLTIPHPRMHERMFVLVPLAEVAPDWVVPTLGRTVAQLLAEVRR